jgi:hypothetical protein
LPAFCRHAGGQTNKQARQAYDGHEASCRTGKHLIESISRTANIRWTNRRLGSTYIRDREAGGLACKHMVDRKADMQAYGGNTGGQTACSGQAGKQASIWGTGRQAYEIDRQVCRRIGSQLDRNAWWRGRQHYKRTAG